MKHQRHVAYSRFHILQHVKAQAWPVLRIFAVDIADACCQEVDSQISNGLALIWIRTLAKANNAVFLTADGAHLSFQGQSHVMCNLNQFLGLLNVLLNWIMGAIEHDGGKSCLDTFIAALV